MNKNNPSHGVFGLFASLALFFATTQLSHSQEMLWTVGVDDNGWPCPSGDGGPDACFVQENWTVNPLPGSPYNDAIDTQADNDYYFAGSYYYVIEGNGVYDPIGVVDYNEVAAERALVPGDYEMRYHFNLPADLKPTDLLSVAFDMMNLDESGGNPRYGVSVYFNGVLVQPQIVITPAQFDIDYTTPPFTLESVNAVVGPDYDNIVTLRGKDYAADGGGQWMGIDYVSLNKESSEVPVPKFPWWVGSDDDGWPAGTGGGANTTFVAGNGSVNGLPGSQNNADNDYYFSGVYDNVVAGNGTYTPVGLVPLNEEQAEGGFAGADNELRYHYNLPVTLQPTDLVAVSFDPLSLDSSVTDPFYGVEVYVNGVLVMPEVVIRKAQLNKAITTTAFTLASVNAQFGLGYDNVVTLRGISHSAEGGGSSLTLDYVRFKPMPQPPALPWSVGQNDNAWPAGDGGGRYASFMAENGAINPLPGNPNSPESDGQADNDYYFAGIFDTVIPANGTYTPVGDVPANEEAAERAFAAADNDLRYHFNLPPGLSPDTKLTFSFEPMNLQDDAPDPRYGAEVYVNGVKVMDEVVVRMENLNRTIFTPPFTLAQVNAGVGQGHDNIVSLRGINYNADGGGNWMGFDYVRLDPVLPPLWPLDCGMDDNGHTGADGGGPYAFFVQEAGVNPLPGNPASGETHVQNDDDYYFAGEYTNMIQSVVDMYGEYEPVGNVLVNEYAAERAFAGSDNELRYHFNLPPTLQPTDKLVVSFDALSLDTGEANWDPRYGVEVYFNGVQVLPEVVIRQDNFDKDFMTEPFTLASVNASVGPGFDNIVTLKGINYNFDGGGNWMGLDYMSVDPMPQPVFPLAVGKDDDGWPAGNGGGENATFVQEANVNPLPGNPKNPERAQQADDDYYFAGVYQTIIPSNEAYYGTYEPVGIVPRNEEAAERAFAGADNELRYHFNLPTTLTPADEVVITFDPLNLHEGTDVPDPRYGIEVYFNSVLVQPEIVIRTNQLNTAISTTPFTLASVNAGFGPGPDNIVSLRGINYNADGGGNWMGFDYVKLDYPVTEPLVFTESKVSNGKLTLKWTGTGNLEWAPALTGLWTPVTPVPSSPYTEDIAPGSKARFYRLKKP